MRELHEIIETYKKEMLALYKIVSEELKTAPAGRIRTVGTSEHPEYYYKMKLETLNQKSNNNENDKPNLNKIEMNKKREYGKYLRKSEQAIVKAIFQRDYNEMVFKEIERQLKVLESLEKKLGEDRFMEIYDKQIDKRKKLITPHIPSDELYVNEWEQFQYVGNTFSIGVSGIYSNRGEQVRSKSEKIIADKLYARGIPYRYECPLSLPGIGTKYPDFTVLNCRKREEYYWEHLGLMGQADYAEKNITKLKEYEKSGYMLGDKLIITYEVTGNDLDTRLVDQLIDHYLI